MRTIRWTVAAVAAAWLAMSPIGGTAFAGEKPLLIICCQCEDCTGTQYCFNNIDDSAICEDLCASQGCESSTLFKTGDGCEVGPACQQVFIPGATQPSPVFSPLGLALAALLAFGAGANQLRLRRRRQS